LRISSCCSVSAKSMAHLPRSRFARFYSEHPDMIGPDPGGGR
jgi:hypothetical protein